MRDEEIPDAPLAATNRRLTLRDVASGEEIEISYPACLPEELDQLVIDEYKRLAIDRPLTTMAEPLFRALFNLTTATTAAGVIPHTPKSTTNATTQGSR